MFLFSMFGDVREMELHYFLADDTVEICERIPNNSGRDAVPMFLRRQKLPKVCLFFDVLSEERKTPPSLISLKLCSFAE